MSTSLVSRALSTAPPKILCYGDSLTAGTTSPFDLYPYAPHLEKKLHSIKPSSKPIVRWLGKPGWTASLMLSTVNESDGLCSLLRRIRDTTGDDASLAVILAGTNDLAYESDSKTILESIIGLHRVAHKENVPTVAVGIPPSEWQMVNGEAKEMARQVNNGLKTWCEEEAMAHFLAFPFNYEKEIDGNWSSDGLHCSERGYKALGEMMAAEILLVLDKLPVK